MNALTLYALFSGLLGLSVHKKWWGGAAFAAAMLVWMIVVQFCLAMTLVPRLN